MTRIIIAALLAAMFSREAAAQYTYAGTVRLRKATSAADSYRRVSFYFYQAGAGWAVTNTRGFDNIRMRLSGSTTKKGRFVRSIVFRGVPCEAQYDASFSFARDAATTMATLGMYVFCANRKTGYAIYTGRLRLR